MGGEGLPRAAEKQLRAKNQNPSLPDTRWLLRSLGKDLRWETLSLELELPRAERLSDTECFHPD